MTRSSGKSPSTALNEEFFSWELGINFTWPSTPIKCSTNHLSPSPWESNFKPNKGHPNCRQPLLTLRRKRSTTKKRFRNSRKGRKLWRSKSRTRRLPRIRRELRRLTFWNTRPITFTTSWGQSMSKTSDKHCPYFHRVIQSPSSFVLFLAWVQSHYVLQVVQFGLKGLGCCSYISWRGEKQIAIFLQSFAPIFIIFFWQFKCLFQFICLLLHL